MKRKNKIIIQIIAAVLFIVGFVLCGCNKNLPGVTDEQTSIQQNGASSSSQSVSPGVVQKARPASLNTNTDSPPKDVQHHVNYGSYTP